MATNFTELEIVKQEWVKLDKRVQNKILRIHALSKDNFESFLHQKPLKGKEDPYTITEKKLRPLLKDFGLKLQITKTK